MLSHFSARRVVVCAAALALAACDQADAPPTAPDAGAAQQAISLETSSLTAAPGAQVAVAVRVTPSGTAQLGGVQGYVRFDATRLRYRGQGVASNTIALVNDAAADRGELRIAAIDAAGLAGRVATLVFDVTAPEYTSGLRFDLEMAATNSPIAALAGVPVAPGVRVATDLDLPGTVARLSAADWEARLLAAPGGPNAARSAVPGAPLYSPGQFQQGLRFGDATLDGTVSLADALYVLNTSVGANQIFIGTDSGSVAQRDAAVAGNPVPFNNPGLGEPGDNLPPGINPDGSRTIDLVDALAILNETVGNNQAVVGELIPGRQSGSGPVYATNRIAVSGNITSDATWTADNVYEIAGAVRVTNGATLTIQAGTRVEGQRGSGPGVGGAALFVQRDGRIVASGTALQPIIMTCTGEPKVKGCWGGLVINGNAPLNDGAATSPAIPGRQTGGALEKNGEGDSGLYGGNNPDDNSGVLRYVRVEYAGFRFTPENELNGVALQGVGRGTVVDFLQVHAGLDDGIEFFGGTVDVKHLYLTANSDDSFDYTEGWSGRAQFVIAQHDSLDADKGIEADNAPAAFDAQPRARPQLYNFTLVGKASPNSTSGTPGNNSVGAMNIRRGTWPTMRNFIVQGFRFALDLDDAQTCTGINADGFTLRNSIFAGNTDLADPDADPSPCGPYSGSDVEAQFIQDPTNANSVVAATPLISPLDVRVPDFRPQFGTAGGTVTPPSDGFFDASATYAGAVPPANAGRSNVPWYAGWTRSWQSPTTP